MVKNEEFYERAQKTRDYYQCISAPLYANIVKKIAGEVFANGDEIPEELIFSYPHVSKYMVEEVLEFLVTDYEKLTQLDNYYVIRKLRLRN